MPHHRLHHSLPGQRQQSDGCDLPGVRRPVPVEHAAEALEFRAIEIADDGTPWVLHDVGAGVRDVLGDLAPLARGRQHGAQDLERAVGRARLVCAGRIELGRHADMVNGVEPQPPEMRHQPIAQVDVECPECGRLPAVPPAFTVAGRERTEQRRHFLSRRRHVLAAPEPSQDHGALPPRRVEGQLRKTPERDLSHPS